MVDFNKLLSSYKTVVKLWLKFYHFPSLLGADRASDTAFTSAPVVFRVSWLEPYVGVPHSSVIPPAPVKVVTLSVFLCHVMSSVRACGL